MNKTFSSLTIVLLIGMIIGLLIGSGRGVVIGQSTGQGNAQSLGSHHQELNFSLAPNETKEIPFPRTNFPVHIEASTPSVHFYDGSISRPLVASTAISLDPATHQAWLPYNGTPYGDNAGGSASLDNVSLRIDFNQELGVIVISTSANTEPAVTAPVNVAVSMWY